MKKIKLNEEKIKTTTTSFFNSQNMALFLILIVYLVTISSLFAIYVPFVINYEEIKPTQQLLPKLKNPLITSSISLSYDSYETEVKEFSYKQSNFLKSVDNRLFVQSIKSKLQSIVYKLQRFFRNAAQFASSRLKFHIPKFLNPKLVDSNYTNSNSNIQYEKFLNISESKIAQLKLVHKSLINNNLNLHHLAAKTHFDMSLFQFYKYLEATDWTGKYNGMR